MNRQISEKLDEHETNIISKVEREKVYKIICLITARILHHARRWNNSGLCIWHNIWLSFWENILVNNKLLWVKEIRLVQKRERYEKISILSPFLFNLRSEYITRMAGWKRCQLVSKLKVNSLKYADAAVLLVKRQLMETKSKIKR